MLLQRWVLISMLIGGSTVCTYAMYEYKVPSNAHPLLGSLTAMSIAIPQDKQEQDQLVECLDLLGIKTAKHFDMFLNNLFNLGEQAPVNIDDLLHKAVCVQDLCDMVNILARKNIFLPNDLGFIAQNLQKALVSTRTDLEYLFSDLDEVGVVPANLYELSDGAAYIRQLYAIDNLLTQNNIDIPIPTQEGITELGVIARAFAEMQLLPNPQYFVNLLADLDTFGIQRPYTINDLPSCVADVQKMYAIYDNLSAMKNILVKNNIQLQEKLSLLAQIFEQMWMKTPSDVEQLLIDLDTIGVKKPENTYSLLISTLLMRERTVDAALKSITEINESVLENEKIEIPIDKRDRDSLARRLYKMNIRNPQHFDSNAFLKYLNTLKIKKVANIENFLYHIDYMHELPNVQNILIEQGIQRIPQDLYAFVQGLTRIGVRYSRDIQDLLMSINNFKVRIPRTFNNLITCYGKLRTMPSYLEIKLAQDICNIESDNYSNKGKRINDKVDQAHQEITDLLNVNLSRYTEMTDPSSKHRIFFDVCAYGTQQMVEKYIAQGANIEARNNKHQSPLMTAAFYGNSGAMKVLLRQGARVEDVCDNQGFNARSYVMSVPMKMLSTQQKYTELFPKLLLAKKLYSKEPFEQCRRLLPIEKIDIIPNPTLEYYSDMSPVLRISEKINDLIHTMYETEKTKAGSKDEKIRKKLDTTIRSLEVLLNSQKSVEEELNEDDFFKVCKYGNRTLLNLFIESKLFNAEMCNSDQQTPLMLAARYGNYAVVDALLNTYGAGTHKKDTFGNTALYHATYIPENLHLDEKGLSRVAKLAFARYPSRDPFLDCSSLIRHKAFLSEG